MQAMKLTIILSQVYTKDLETLTKMGYTVILKGWGVIDDDARLPVRIHITNDCPKHRSPDVD